MAGDAVLMAVAGRQRPPGAALVTLAALMPIEVPRVAALLQSLRDWGQHLQEDL